MSILGAALVIFFCSFVQTVAGFAFSLFAIPLLLLCGFGLADAVVTSMVCSMIQRLLLVHKCRNSIEWMPLFKMYPIALLGLALGIFALKKAVMFDQDTIKIIFGVIILLAVGMRLFIHVEPRDSVPFYLSGIASFFSGLLNGFANIGGPPMVLWILAHKWPKDRLRATIPAFTLMMIPVQIVLLWIGFGAPILLKSVQGLLYFPLIILAAVAGNICSHKMSTEKIRTVIIILLAVTGLSYIIYPIIKKLIF